MDGELGVEEGLEGPVGRRMKEFGPVIPLVFGTFGEFSEGVQDLITTHAKVRTEVGQGGVRVWEDGVRGEAWCHYR